MAYTHSSNLCGEQGGRVSVVSCAYMEVLGIRCLVHPAPHLELQICVLVALPSCPPPPRTVLPLTTLTPLKNSGAGLDFYFPIPSHPTHHWGLLLLHL